MRKAAVEGRFDLAEAARMVVLDAPALAWRSSKQKPIHECEELPQVLLLRTHTRAYKTPKSQYVRMQRGVKNGKSMMMKLEDIREVPAVGPSYRRGATKCTVKIR